MEISSQSLKQLSGIPDEVVGVGQASWSPDSQSIAFVGWQVEQKERKLGIKYCYNRR